MQITRERLSIQIISSEAMDTVAGERPSELTMRHRAVSNLDRLGYNLRDIIGGLDRGSTHALSSLAGACALLHADWQHAQTSMSSLHPESGEYMLEQSR